jgi:hypothetical protein
VVLLEQLLDERVRSGPGRRSRQVPFRRDGELGVLTDRVHGLMTPAPTGV